MTDKKSELLRRIIDARRGEPSVASTSAWDQIAVEIESGLVREEAEALSPRSSATLAATMLWSPETEPDPTIAHAAGGYSGNFLLTQGGGHVAIEAQWSSEGVTLRWQYDRLPPSSFLIAVFRIQDPIRPSIARAPFVMGRLDASPWSATADDVGIDLMIPWSLQVLFIADAE